MGFWSFFFGEAPVTAPREGGYRDGKQHGVWIEWVKDGFSPQPYLMESTYRDGVRNGPYREFRDGRVLERGAMVNGKLDGAIQYFRDDGTRRTEISYAEGRLHGWWREYSPMGLVDKEKEYRDNKLWTGDYDLGGERGRYEDGVKVGPWVSRTERGTYVAGRKHGAFQLDDGHEQQRGRFDMDARVGAWEIRIIKSNVVLAGEFPRGERVTWTAARDGRTVELEVANASELWHWTNVAESLFTQLPFDMTKMSDDERKRAKAWLAAHTPARVAKKRDGVVAHAPIDEAGDDEDDTLAEFVAFEAAARDRLVHALGEIHGEPAPRGDDDFDYMDRWFPPIAGTLVVVGTLEVPGPMIACSPECHEPTRLYRFRPGTYEVVGCDTGDRLHLPLAVARLPGARVVGWRYLGAAHDSDFGLFAPDVDLEHHDYPEAPDDAVGPAEWIRPDVGPTLWITNPAGNGLRAYGGVAEDGALVALFVQGY